MAAKPLTKKLVQNRLTMAEIAIGKLEAAFKQTSYRQNPVVQNCINKASRELEAALQCLYDNELQRAFNLGGIAWLQADFGRQILEAEVVEHLLGESNYIELNEFAIPWESKARALLNEIESEFKALRNDINAGKEQLTAPGRDE